MTRVAIEHLRLTRDPRAAARAAVTEVTRFGGTAGVILVDATGEIGWHTSTRRMPWAAVVDGVRSCGAEPHAM
jgi:isoaspartyl peptidase/L-asparaginase-like protein (Ntn-hydrolase superfamily)